ARFGSALEGLTEGLSNTELKFGTVDEISRLVFDTCEMRDTIISLNRQLDESQRKINQLREDVDRARSDALTDSLTGLTNRKGFDLALAKCLSAFGVSEKSPSMLIVDIDNFKLVNDKYGHLFGDKVLRAVANTLMENVKGKDTAARFGGEEFVILLPETSIVGARSLAENVRSLIEKKRIPRSEGNAEMVKVTASLGVASYCAGESANEFIGRVDSALYESKNHGRNLVTISTKPAQAAL
ncbi:MAG TPA: GGDEF domain-containing protein, partial [Methylobacter sp.]